MTRKLIICDSSAVISLHRISRLDLLHQLFDEVIVPQSVASEVQEQQILPPWIVVHPDSGVRVGMGDWPTMGRGEAEVLQLAVILNPVHVLLDDLQARRTATKLNLSVIGCLGILLRAKRNGLLTQIRPCIESLRQNGFRADTKLLEQVLRDAGE